MRRVDELEQRMAEQNKEVKEQKRRCEKLVRLVELEEGAGTDIRMGF